MRAADIRSGGGWQGLASVLLFIGLWQIGAAFADSRLLPGPGAVLNSLIGEARNGALFYHLGITLARVAVSFIIAMVIGTALGMALGLWRALDRWLNPWLVILLNVPALVVIILTYIWLGLVETALLVAVALNKIPNVAVTLREGARALDRDYAEMAQIYRLGPWTTLQDIIIPQLAPYLLAAARNGLALIWKIVLVVELLGRSNGVGFQLQSYFQLFDVPRVLAYAASFVACVLLIEFLIFAPFERRIDVWRR